MHCYTIKVEAKWIADVVEIGGFWIIDPHSDIDTVLMFRSKKELEKYVNDFLVRPYTNITWDLKFDC
jgi:hypothetical protein